MSGSQEEMFDVIKDHFAARLKAAIAKLTGDFNDELFMSPEKAAVMAGEWFQREFSGEELYVKMIAAAPEEKLYEWRDEAKRRMKLLGLEIERRREP